MSDVQNIAPKNHTIMIIRVLAMFMIIACHICGVFKLNSISNIFRIGVQVFLFMSGYLHVKMKLIKNIKEYFEFIKKKFLRINIPVYIYALCIAVVSIMLKNSIDLIKVIFIYGLDLRGIDSLLGWFVIEEPLANGMANLWFLTPLMICYLILPLLAPITLKLSKERALQIMIFTFVGMLLFTFAKIYLIDLYIFILGFVCAKFNVEIKKRRQYVVLTFAMTALMLIKYYIDDALFYSACIMTMQKLLFTLWIIVTIAGLVNKCKQLLNFIGKSKLISFIDKLSYYIYIIHYSLLAGPFFLFGIINNKASALMLFLCVAFAAAMILMFLSRLTVKLFKLNINL